jgi:N-acetylglutamate synthase
VVNRANSVWAGATGVLPLLDKVQTAEDWYTARERRVRFQLSPVSAPTGLSDRLAARAYRFEGAVAVCVVDIAHASEPSEGVVLTDAPTRDWFTAHAASLTSGEAAPRHRLAAAAPGPKQYATIDTSACGLAVADGDLVGLFNVATAPNARRSGRATRITRALLAWGAARGATRAYLQVALANDAARALYANLGFRDAYTYVYAVAATRARPACEPSRPR